MEADAEILPRSPLSKIGRVVLILMALLVLLVVVGLLANLVWVILDPSHRM